MTSNGVTRKLTAILSADVAGYSRLMGEDEVATVATLGDYRGVFLEQIASHHGTVVDAKGDAVLAEFPSVVDAVQCAVRIQREIYERNAQLPEQRRMQFRIGINLGDVIVKDDAIYGDGVNIAARLETLAEPGGICIARSVFDQVKSKMPLEFEYLGEQSVKNIAEPVRAYRLLPPDLQESQASPYSAAPPAGGSESSTRSPSTEIPSLAVLAFQNLSSDPEQEHFGDGISEDIITDLSKYPDMTVTARNSSFAYKGRSVDVRQMGRELGVRYLLEGSVRKSGNRVRITAQLIETETGNHAWASRYDRTLEDVFAIQDEITEEIVTALGVKLLEGDLQRVWRKYLKTPEARELYREGSIFYTRLKWDESLRAREIFQQVISLEPESPSGYNGVGWTYCYEAWYRWGKDPEKALRKAREMAEEALTRDDTYPAGLILLGAVCLLEGDHDRALAEAEQAETLAPNHAHLNANLGIFLTYAGNPEKGMAKLQRAIRLNPSPPPWYFGNLALAYFGRGRFAEAIEAAERGMQKDAEWARARLIKAAAHQALGESSQAEREANIVLADQPEFSLTEFGKTHPFKDPTHLDALLGPLREAGLPE